MKVAHADSVEMGMYCQEECIKGLNAPLCSC